MRVCSWCRVNDGTHLFRFLVVPDGRLRLRVVEVERVIVVEVALKREIGTASHFPEDKIDRE